MRSRSVVPTLLTFVAGAAVAVAVRRLARRRSAVSLAAPVVAAPAGPAPAVAEEAGASFGELQAVVLPFPRPPVPAAAQPAPPVRCGENGGRTKAGAPCAARGTVAGRCHHHRVAA